MDDVRPAAVAGMFYPDDPTELASQVRTLLDAATHPQLPPHPEHRSQLPKALIVPHAGYVYSGPIAASAFALLRPYAEQIQRIVLVGPAHRIAVHGLAWPGTARMATPLGDVEIDTAAIGGLSGRVDIAIAAHPAAHAREHCLEVMLPFLREVAPHARVVPFLASRVDPAELGRVLDTMWGGPETVFVISSDLSHYLPYDAGRAKDRRTAERILARDPTLEGDDACGAVGIDGLLWLARKRDLRVELVDLRSSGDTAGDRARVVGYGAFACYEGS